jgi:hypothetical protein
MTKSSITKCSRSKYFDVDELDEFAEIAGKKLFFAADDISLDDNAMGPR